MTPSDNQGQRRERGPEAHEDDPTGVRELLASLSDPGPMPDHLVERIEARLAVEQAHRDQRTGGAFAARSDSVIDLAAERSHRRPGRTVAMLGAAAAGLLVATMAIGEFAGVGPASGPAFESAAQVPARGSGADTDDAAGADAGAAEALSGGDEGASPDEEADEGAGAGAGADGDDFADGETGSQALGGADATEDAQSGGAGSGSEGRALADTFSADVVVLPQLGAVSTDDYQERILELVEDSDRSRAAAAGSLTAAGARWCWQAVDTAAAGEPWPALHAAQAEMGGDRVVVLLGMQDEAAGEALVLPWACTAGEDVDPIDAVAWPSAP